MYDFKCSRIFYSKRPSSSSSPPDEMSTNLRFRFSVQLIVDYFLICFDILAKRISIRRPARSATHVDVETKKEKRAHLVRRRPKTTGKRNAQTLHFAQSVCGNLVGETLECKTDFVVN